SVVRGRDACSLLERPPPRLLQRGRLRLCRQQPLDPQLQRQEPGPHPGRPVLRELLASPPPLLHAGLCVRGGKCPRLPPLQQPLGGPGGWLCLSRRAGAHPSPPSRPRRRRTFRRPPGSRRGRGLDLEPQGLGRRGVRSPFAPRLPPLSPRRGGGRAMVRRILALFPARRQREALRRDFPGCAPCFRSLRKASPPGTL